MNIVREQMFVNSRCTQVYIHTYIHVHMLVYMYVYHHQYSSSGSGSSSGNSNNFLSNKVASTINIHGNIWTYMHASEISGGVLHGDRPNMPTWF